MRFAAFFFGTVMLALTLTVVAGVGVFLRYGGDLPDIRQLATYEPPVTSRVYAGDGRLMAEYAAEKRVFVPIEAIPRRVVQAFLSAEDKNFYAHDGIDATGVVRAIMVNIENYGSDRRLVGASTITQQVAKNFLLSGEVSFERKIKEAILAFRLDRAFSKDRILELYLNEIYLGAGSYGIAAAALNYFDKSLDDLGLAESAVLAALPKAPSNYDPIRQPAAAQARRDWVIRRMLEDGHITAEDAIEARSQPVVTNRRRATDPVEADYFAEEVRRELVRHYGEAALYKGGLVAHATLDPILQTMADTALRDGLEQFDRRRGWRGPVARIAAADLRGDWAARLRATPAPDGLGDWRLAVLLHVGEGEAKIGFADGGIGRIPAAEMRWLRHRADGRGGAKPGDVVPVSAVDGGIETWRPRQIPEVSGALVALDPHTGAVLAMSGGWDYALSEFNRATQAMRQPGSTFKPIVYLCALEEGYTPSSVVLDAPIVVSQGPGVPAWSPSNYSHRYYGPTTLRMGLEQSRNVMTVRLAEEVGMEKVVDCARRLGVSDTMRPYPAYALGAGETTLLRLTAAYGMMVNGGRRIDPSVIDRVQDRYGRVVFRHDRRSCVECNGVAWADQPVPLPPDESEAVTDPHSAFQVVSMLEGVVERGTGQRVKVVGKPLAGKTGTSNDARDVWFVGFSPDLVAGVYIGYDDPESLGDHAAGGTLAAPIFADFMQQALAETPAIPFRTPPGIRMVRVDSATGRPARTGSPRMIFEAFKPGTAPPLPGEGARRTGGGSTVQVPATGTGGLY